MMRSKVLFAMGLILRAFGGTEIDSSDLLQYSMNFNSTPPMNKDLFKEYTEYAGAGANAYVLRVTRKVPNGPGAGEALKVFWGAEGGEEADDMAEQFDALIPLAKCGIAGAAMNSAGTAPLMPQVFEGPCVNNKGKHRTKGKTCYYVRMEYAGDVSMEKCLKHADTKLTGQIFLKMVIATFKMMLCFHEKQLYHKDLQTKNLVTMVYRSGRNKDKCSDLSIKAVDLDTFEHEDNLGNAFSRCSDPAKFVGCCGAGAYGLDELTAGTPIESLAKKIREKGDEVFDPCYDGDAWSNEELIDNEKDFISWLEGLSP